MEESETYYVRRRGRVDGPWPLSKIKAEIGLLKLGKYHEISSDGTTWRRASEMPELFAKEIVKKTLGRTDGLSVDGEIHLAADAAGSAPIDQWYYCADGQQQIGPVTLQELLGCVMNGRCSLDTLAWKEGYGDWLPIENIPEVMSVLNIPVGYGASTTAATQFVPITSPVPARSQKSVYAFVVGLTALLLSWFPFFGFVGFIAIVLGIWGIIDIRRSNSQLRGVAWASAGIVTGMFAILTAILLLVGLAAAIFMS